MRTLHDIILDHPRWVAEQIALGNIGPRRRQLRTMVDLPVDDPKRGIEKARRMESSPSTDS